MLATGPTGDSAVAEACGAGGGGTIAVLARLDGSGRTIEKLGFALHSLWGSIAFGAHDELAYSWNAANAFSVQNVLTMEGTHPVSWSSLSTGPGMGGAYFQSFRIDAIGNVFATAQTDSAITLDPTLTLPAPGTYLLRGGISGEARYTSPPAGFAPDDQGGVFFYGPLQSTVDFGCGPLVPGASSGYVARLDPSWSCLWADVLPVAPSILPDGSGGVVLFATSSSALDLGCGSLPAAPSGSTFVARLDAAGACVFGAAFGAPDLALALDPAGQLVVSGLVGATAIDLGGGPLAPLGANDLVIGALDAAGAPVWSRRFGGAGVTWSGTPTVALPTTGDAYVLANHTGAVDWGGGAIAPAAASDLVIASFTAAGAHRWSRALPIAGKYGASVDGCGGVVVASVDGKFDPGCGLVIPGNDPASWPPVPPPAIGLARFQP